MISSSGLRKGLIMLALGLFLLKFVYLPYDKKLTAIKEEYQKTLQMLFLKQQETKITSQQIKDIEKELQEEIKEKFFEEKEDPILIQFGMYKDLERLIKDKKIDVKIQNIEFLPLTQRKSLIEISVQVKFKGKPREIFKYLQEIENYFSSKGKFIKFGVFSLQEMGDEVLGTLKISSFKLEFPKD